MSPNQCPQINDRPGGLGNHAYVGGTVRQWQYNLKASKFKDFHAGTINI
jgi:hypothetical protein